MLEEDIPIDGINTRAAKTYDRQGRCEPAIAEHDRQQLLFDYLVARDVVVDHFSSNLPMQWSATSSRQQALIDAVGSLGC